MSGNRFFLSHDGAIDELIALLLLARRRDVDLIGISLTSADCLTEQAMEAQHRLLDGERHLAQALESAGDKGLTILATGPLTQLQLVLEREPRLESHIRDVVWMGGAVDVPGNLEAETLPGVPVGKRAEWNAFWDPFAVDWIFGNTTVPLSVVPLDVSDQARLSAEFLDGLEQAGRNSTAARLARDAYQLVLDQPMYRLWDMTAVCFALQPEFFAKPKSMRLAVEVWGPEQGALTPNAAGREASVVQAFAPGGLERMHALIIDSLV